LILQTEVSIHVRAINIERDGGQCGTYYQAVRSYRENGKVKQEVVHLGEYSTADEALTAWADDVRQLQTTRPRKAEKLQRKIERLRDGVSVHPSPTGI
jgi:polyhydroxyalkanoate synthesis regulator phasin